MKGDKKMKVRIGYMKYEEKIVDIDDKFEPLSHEDYNWFPDGGWMTTPLAREFDSYISSNKELMAQLPPDVDLDDCCCITSLDGEVVIAEW